MLTTEQEAEDDCIDLPEDDPEMIRRMIVFLYYRDYDPTGIYHVDRLGEVLLAVDGGNRAPKYHTRGNCQDCACMVLLSAPIDPPQPWTCALTGLVRSRTAMKEHPSKLMQVASPLSTHATMYALGDKYQVEGLCAKSLEKFRSSLFAHRESEDFIDAVQIAYTSTLDSNRGLRDAIIQALEEYFDIHIIAIPGAEEELPTINRFSMMLLRHCASEADKKRSKRQAEDEEAAREEERTRARFAGVRF